MSTQRRMPELANSGFVTARFSIHGVQDSRITLLHTVWNSTSVAMIGGNVL